MYAAHGVTLALAWFLAINVAASAAAIAAARGTRGSAPLLLALRLCPAILSIVFVLGVFVPSYWRFEPRDVAEGFDLTLPALAAGALAVIAFAVVRGGRAWWQAAQRARAWTLTAEPLAIDSAVPAFRIEAAEPVLALVGILRPRLIVARGLIDALTADELSAAIQHEIEHSRSRDNLKRLLLRAAPDVLRWTPAAEVLERKWAAAAERIADAGASAGRGRGARLALASALIKVARLMPSLQSMLDEPISTLVGGGDIAARVHTLIDDDDLSAPAGRSVRRRAALALVSAAALILAGYAPLIEHVHRLTELFVRTLP